MHMNELYLYAALLLLATVTAGLLRVLYSTGKVERLLALQVLGTTLVAVVLLLAEALDRPGLRDLALAMALLSPIVAVAFVRYWVLTHDGTGDGHG